MTMVTFTVREHIAYVRLNRPQVLNAISAEVDAALFSVWTAINADPNIWVAIISGEGDRAFCVGADITDDLRSERKLAFGGGLTGVGGAQVALTKPLIAAVHGYVLGGGFELTLCADIIVAASDTLFGLPEVRSGIIGECGVVHRAIRQLPCRVALAMIMTGENLSAERALHYGLINAIVEPEQLMEVAEGWAQKVCAASPLAVQAARSAALEMLEAPLSVALSSRYNLIESYQRTSDYEEGRRAILERRTPVWTGR